MCIFVCMATTIFGGKDNFYQDGFYHGKYRFFPQVGKNLPTMDLTFIGGSIVDLTEQRNYHRRPIADVCVYILESSLAKYRQ